MREPVIPAKLNKLLIKEAFEPFSCDHSCLSSESFICALLITLIYLRTRKELYLWWQRKSTLFDLDWLFQRSCQTFSFHHFIKDMPAICGLYKISLIRLKMSHHFPLPPSNNAALVLIIFDFLYVICSLSPMAYLVGQYRVWQRKHRPLALLQRY